VAAFTTPSEPALAELVGTFDAFVPEAAGLLSWAVRDRDGARARLARRYWRWAAHETRATGGHGPGSPPAELAAHGAWLLLEACGAAFDPSSGAAGGLRLFDELWLREPLARAFRARGAEDPLAWRLAARVRAMLAHPHVARAGEGERAWPEFLADADARFAAGLPAGAHREEAPDWLALAPSLASEETQVG
jgi:hypothetical protein